MADGQNEVRHDSRILHVPRRLKKKVRVELQLFTSTEKGILGLFVVCDDDLRVTDLEVLYCVSSDGLGERAFLLRGVTNLH